MNLFEKIDKVINEASLSKGVEKELILLINNIKSGTGVDKRSMENDTDGEILADFLSPVFQSALLNIKDRKSFKKGFRF